MTMGEGSSLRLANYTEEESKTCIDYEKIPAEDIAEERERGVNYD